MAEVRRVIAVLDTQFSPTPADVPHFAKPTRGGGKKVKQKARADGATTKATPGAGHCPPGELSIVFLRDEELAQIHADFMNDPSATDVITFEGEATAGLAGEICVSADTAAAYAREAGGDFAEELVLYVVHGWLHLAGYDDLQPARKRRMRAAEKRAMTLLRAASAVPVFALR